MPDFRILLLDERQLAEAYPLVRSATDVSPDRWKKFARELIASGGGVLAVQAADSCLHGVAAFRQVGTLRHELSLQVELLAAFELSRLAPVRKALCAALEDLARRKGCRNILFTVAADAAGQARSGLHASLEARGARLATVSMVQKLAGEAACG
jgi:hypothetical protein